MEFSIFLLFALIPILARGAQHYRNTRQVEHQKGSWKALADATNMKFVPAALLAPSRIEGVYRGYKVSIRTYSKNAGATEDEMWTEIRLTMPETSKHASTGKPDIGAVEHFLNRQKSILPYFDRSLQFQNNEVKYLESRVRSSVDKLKLVIDHLCDLAEMYNQTIQLGGEAVPLLLPIASDKGNVLHAMALRLLREIESYTASRFASRFKSVHCTDCLTSFSSHEIDLGFLSFYGCRTCRQSFSFFENLSPVLVLDNQMKDKYVQHDNFLYVNGFKRQKLFDFNEVIIDNASDKEVAAFAIKIGNDTDAIRIKRYAAMSCTVMAHCPLSKNTRHMLQRVFGRVLIKRAA